MIGYIQILLSGTVFRLVELPLSDNHHLINFVFAVFALLEAGSSQTFSLFSEKFDFYPSSNLTFT